MAPHKNAWILLAATGAGALLIDVYPFPAQHPLLVLIRIYRPVFYQALALSWPALLISTGWLALNAAASVGYIFFATAQKPIALLPLPPYPDPASRPELYLILGELHHPKRPDPAAAPDWLRIPARGLYAGTIIIGAVGSGKTAGCMYPFAEQILAWRAADADRKAGALILEVKGDFCHKVREILARHGRADDYIELSLSGEWLYNPLHGEQEAYAMAYGLASAINNLYGRGKEPFWQQAYTNLVKFVILLHQVLFDYCTWWDVYICAIHPPHIDSLLQKGQHRFGQTYILIDSDTYLKHPGLERFPFELDPTGQMRCPAAESIELELKRRNIEYELELHAGDQVQPSPELAHKQAQFEACSRWFYHDWRAIEPKLRTSIVEGVSVFLSLFDDNPDVRKVFCPPKKAKTGKPLPGIDTLLEQGKVIALNLPVAMNPGLARALGTMLKQDFQRAVLNRIPKMVAEPEKTWRDILFLCDEYHTFATVGESDPSGDEKFFALSRQARCIPIVATQSISSLASTLPGESWRTLLQTFRTKIFLALSDPVSAKTAAELCGREEKIKPNYTLSESGHNAQVSMLTGRATAHHSALTTSKSYSVQFHNTFEPKIFSELKNMQAIVLAYDGTNPMPPSYLYLKPYYLERSVSYFEQLRKGQL